jgi:hypothetical protein
MNDNQKKLADAIINNTKLKVTSDGLFEFLKSSIFASSLQSNKSAHEASCLHEDHPGG